MMPADNLPPEFPYASEDLQNEGAEFPPRQPMPEEIKKPFSYCHYCGEYTNNPSGYCCEEHEEKRRMKT